MVEKNHKTAFEGCKPNTLFLTKTLFAPNEVQFHKGLRVGRYGYRKLALLK